jgi:hypothetical protein
VKDLVAQAAGYNLLIKSDDSLFVRKRIDPDKLTYRLNCTAVNILRVEVRSSLSLPSLDSFPCPSL